jgi:archaellum component FlaC
MKITKQKLISLIKEAIQEIDKSPAVEKAVQSDESMEELLAAMAERMSELENEIQRLKSEYSNASARMGQITGKQ